MERGSALEGFAALYDGTGNSAATVPITVQTKVTVDDDLVQLCHSFGERPFRDQPLGRISDVYPFVMLKKPLLEHAREFSRQVRSQGYEARTPAEEFLAWGPYMEKVGEVQEWIPEEGNHVIPAHLRRKAVRAWGYRGDEFNWNKGASFIIVGSFQKAAALGRVSEETGVIIV